MIYSDRPWMIMACDLVGHSGHCIFSPYNDRLRRFRRMFHGILGGADNIAMQAAVSEHETRRFLTRLLRDPGNVKEELRRCVRTLSLFFSGLRPGICGRLAGAIIVKVCHGYELVPEGPDPMIDLVERVMIEFTDVTAPGHYLVDVMPWCELTSFFGVYHSLTATGGAVTYLPAWLPGMGFKKTARAMRKTLLDGKNVPVAYVKEQMVHRHC
jgi:hypothetical protein